MVVFGVDLDERENMKEAFLKMKDRFENAPNIASNPFTGFIDIFESWVCISIIPLLGHTYIFGLILFFGSLLVFGVSWFLIPSVILCLPGIFRLQLFYKVMTILMLRKQGVKGKIVFADADVVVARLLPNGSN